MRTGSKLYVTYPSHGFVIDRDEAMELGGSVKYYELAAILRSAAVNGNPLQVSAVILV